jgi:hypothetical protein
LVLYWKNYKFHNVSDSWSVFQSVRPFNSRQRWARTPKGRTHFVIKTLVNVSKHFNRNDFRPFWQAFKTMLAVPYKILLERLIAIHLVMTFLVIMNHSIPNASSLILSWYRNLKYIFLSYVSKSTLILSQQMLESPRFCIPACSFRPKILHVVIVLLSWT